MAGRQFTIGLIRGFDEHVAAHQVVPLALRHAAEATGTSLQHAWVPTESITSPQS